MRIAVALLGLVLVACGGSNKQTPETCGNGVVDPGEQCDGDANCTASCTFVCSNAAQDCPAPPTCGVAACTADHACMVQPASDGAACGSNGACQMGMCVPASCGDGIPQSGEQCDFGSDNGLVPGCNIDCTFSCSGASCDDNDPCNGVETCASVTHNGNSGQACAAGTPLDNGTSCGSNMVCVNAACIAGVCGDGYVTGTEECDDANSNNGDGCNNNCTFSCVSTDSTRNCTPADSCAGQGTCNDATHVCAPGTALPDNTFCGTTGFCKTGVCTQPVCGNGIVERGEDCDGGTGCKADCHWQCVNAVTDCAAAPACNMEQCTAQHTCQTVADSTQNGNACGASGTCSNGTCQTSGATCGNGVVEGSEQCDFGGGNGPGTGCESNCTFSCSSNAQCLDTNPCNGAETCSSVTVNGHMGQKCAAGTAEANGTNCGTAKICISQQCVASTCGDGYIDPTANESCEPPNQNGCDANCQKCGDSIRGVNEQCDDGNLTNLDGCDSSCKFEQVQRMTTFKVAFMHSTTCPKDAMGEAIVGNDSFGQPGSRTQITQAIDNGIADGSITVELDELGMTDLTGVSAQTVHIGILGGTHTVSTATYDGTADKDWWYTTDPATINASRIAIKQLTGTISARNLSTTPGEILVTVSFVGVAVTMDIFHATLTATLSASDTPTTSTNSMAPGHLASEHLAPTLTSFATMAAAGTTTGCTGNISATCRCFNVTNGAGTAATCPTGELCGLVTARSLYNVLTPSALTGTTCNNFYSTTNTLLDVYISGCKYAGLITEVKVTQPDASIDNAGNPATDVYVFTPGANHSIANGTCTKNGVADTLNDCLDHAAYTSLFQWTADRVIAK
ncbi:MAG: DUF4215 domain-containing protein [Deltaproteobacteria bacterium]|nr:DUF4215 domain-containing protein [Deltaproteobacteria bacterium]